MCGLLGPFLAHQIQLVCCHQYNGLESRSVECEDDPDPCKLNFEGDPRLTITLGQGQYPICLYQESAFDPLPPTDGF